MSSSTIDNAYSFYTRHIYDEEIIYLLQQHNLKVAGHVPSVIWELFGSILTGRIGNGTTGADLQGWEVKSSTWGGAFEYQYHLNTENINCRKIVLLIIFSVLIHQITEN